MKRLLSLFIFCGVAIDTFSQCTTYTPKIILGSNSISASPTFLKNATGLDRTPDLTITSGTFTIDIANTNTCSNWEVSVVRDNTINTDLKFYVIRTSEGIGTPDSSIEAASLANFVEIKTFPQTFIRGVNNRTSIQISYKITGISVKMDASTYLSNITFSVTGTP
jgi:hypothetical protein